MKLAAAVFAALLAFSASAATAVYDLTMWLKVPRVYDNANSRGKRKYQAQKIVGTLYVETDCETEPTFCVSGLRNKTHKVGGACVTYTTTVEGTPFWHAVGSNATGKFKTASVRIDLDAEPSYNIGDPDEPDNTLLVTLAGSGTAKRIHGYVSGQIGCGCTAYGHLSPTRIMWTNTPTDIAAVYGRFTAKLRD